MEPTHSSSLSHIYLVVLVLKYEKPGKLTNVLIQPLNDWNVSNVTDMEGMFGLALSFNQPLNNWNVSNVRNMRHMFLRAESFNQSLNNWDVTNMESMFIITRLRILRIDTSLLFRGSGWAS